VNGMRSSRARAVSGGAWDRSRPLVVMMGANPFDAPMADRHMARHLTAHSRVLYVEPPFSPLSGLRHALRISAPPRPALRIVEDDLAVLTPVSQPFPDRTVMHPLTRQVVRLAVRRAVRRLGRPDILVTARPVLPDLDVVDARTTVFWAQDDLVGGAALLGVSAEALEAGSEELARNAQVVVAGTPWVAEHWQARGLEPVLVPYGCEVDMYADVDALPAPPDVSYRGPAAGFVGFLGDRVDYGLLEAVLDSGVHVIVVGAVHERSDRGAADRLLRHPQVTWVGPKRFSELPPYVSRFTVGLVPYLDNPFNRGSFPLKTLEYLAAGRDVVATPLPGVTWLDTDLVRTAWEPEPFVAAVLESLERPATKDEIERRRSFAAQHSWAVRAESFARAVGLQ
jgi:teichuronic acid biosynthesis glycosyltransferase TuaH